MITIYYEDGSTQKITPTEAFEDEKQPGDTKKLVETLSLRQNKEVLRFKEE